jgi:hypothetical protein
MDRRGMLAMLLLAAGLAVGAPPPITYADGRLTARLDRVPLAEVLDRLAEATGARIGGDPGEPRDVTAQFEELPIDRALERLLGTQSFTLRYAADGRLLSIDLRGVPAPSAPPAQAEVVMPDLQRYRVRLTQPLQQALRREFAPLAVILRTTGEEVGPKLRTEAARLAVTTIEADAKLHAAIMRMSDEAFLGLLRGYANRRTAELLGAMMGAARSFELRTKATRALQELRASEQAG